MLTRIATLVFICIGLCAASTTLLHAATDVQSVDHQITASDGTELAFERYPAQGEYLILSIAPGYGIHERTRTLATQLAATGIEVWQIDLAEALFLPHSTEQMRSFTGKYVADLIRSAHQETGKKIILNARSYGAVPLLRGVRLWQTRKPEKAYVIGAILFSPDLYTTIPSLGMEPDYLPIVSATNIPIMIFQDGTRGTRWYVDKLIDTLKVGGSQTYLKVLPGVSALFFNEDTAAATLKALAKLSQDIKISIQLLEKTAYPLSPAAMTKSYSPLGSGLDHRLKPFKGQFQPYPINLRDANGKLYKRESYSGQITIVNFWATWCPPCVREIPSLNRLREKMQGTPFELVSINFAESPQTISEFLKQVDVEFPVLLDETGKVSANWHVVAFPSTFIIGPDGNIHYGVNAGIEWDNPDVINTLRKLLPH